MGDGYEQQVDDSWARPVDAPEVLEQKQKMEAAREAVKRLEAEKEAKRNAEVASLQAANDLLRALLWAMAEPLGSDGFGWWSHFVPEPCFKWHLHGMGTVYDLGPDCDLSRIPADVAARLVADWRARK